MANSIFGGFMESLGPAIQQGREGQLKQQMLKMQMQQYEQQTQKFAAEQALEQKRAALMQQIQAEPDPVKKRALMAQGAMGDKEWKTAAALGGPPPPTMAENMAAVQKLLMPGGGGPGQPGGGVFANQQDINPTMKSDGSYSIALNTARPTGDLAKIQGIIQLAGADASNLDVQQGAFAVAMAPPEVQSMKLQKFIAQYGGRGGQPQQQQPMGQQPQQSQAGMEITSPTGARVMVDNPETLAEMQAQGWPMAQGQAVPQQQAPQPQRYAGSGGGSEYDVVRGKETAATIERAGGSERARTLNEGMSKEERAGIGATQSVMNAVNDLEQVWEPGFTGVESIGGAIREKTGLMGNKEARFRTIYNNLKRLDIRASAGLSQTASEMENAIAALGEPKLADSVFQERLGTVRSILDQAQAIDDQLLTAPRSAVPGILQQQRITRQPYEKKVGTPSAQQSKQASGLAVGSQVDDLAGIPDNATFRDESGRLFKKVNGKKMPWGGK